MRKFNPVTGRSAIVYLARQGGNWQGLEYLTYAEHDRCVRAAIRYGYAMPSMREALYEGEKTAIIAARHV